MPTFHALRRPDPRRPRMYQPFLKAADPQIYEASLNELHRQNDKL